MTVQAVSNVSTTIRAAFISFASADQAQAMQIADGLASRGITPWIAPQSIRPGMSWPEEILRGIESSDAMVVVLSQATAASRWVPREVERAISKGKVVFPVKLERCSLTAAMEFFLSSIHWIDLAETGLDKAVDDLELRMRDPDYLSVMSRLLQSRWRAKRRGDRLRLDSRASSRRLAGRLALRRASGLSAATCLGLFCA